MAMLDNSEITRTPFFLGVLDFLYNSISITFNHCYKKLKSLRKNGIYEA